MAIAGAGDASRLELADLEPSGAPADRRRRAGAPSRWILRRLAAAVATIFVLSIAVFCATQVLPGDAAQAFLGTRATPERLAQLRAEMGLDQSVVTQYTDWAIGLVQGDPGESLAKDVPVSSLIGDRLLNSLILLFLAAGIAIPLSVLLGVYAAVNRDGSFDKSSLVVMLVLASLPEFVIGISLVTLFGTTVFQVLPAVALVEEGQTPFSNLTRLILPVATLVLAAVPYLSRLVRGSMIEVLESEYVQMARLKGIPEREVIRRHALPNALVAVIQASALMLAYLLAGVVVVEYIFAYPGLGTGLTEAIGSRDLPVIQAITFIFAVAVVLFNMLADILTILVTPRLRTRAWGG